MFKDADERVQEIADESEKLRSDMEALTKEIDAEEERKTAAKVTFLEGLETQLEEKRKQQQRESDLEKVRLSVPGGARTREERFSDANALAARLAEWDIDGQVGVTVRLIKRRSGGG